MTGSVSDPLAGSAILVVVAVCTELTFTLEGNQIGGDDIQELLKSVREWFEDFCHWLWVLTAQSLDPTNRNLPTDLRHFASRV